MRRLLIFILCCMLLTTAVFAAGSVTDLQSNAVISDNGTCEITMVLQLTLDQTEERLRFPLPWEARDITLNGSGAKVSRADSLRWVNLSGAVYGPGSYTITLHYTLPDLVVSEKEELLLTLPRLLKSGCRDRAHSGLVDWNRSDRAQYSKILYFAAGCPGDAVLDEFADGSDLTVLLCGQGSAGNYRTVCYTPETIGQMLQNLELEA